MVRLALGGACIAGCAWLPAGAALAVTTPLVDVAGERAYVSVGAYAFGQNLGGSASADVGVWPGVSIGFAGGGDAPYGAGAVDSRFLAARTTLRGWTDGGWVIGGTVSVIGQQWAGGTGSRIVLVPQIAFGRRVSDFEGMPMRARVLAGPIFAVDGFVNTAESLLPIINAELAVEVRPHLELVLGGGSLVGMRTIW